MNTSELANPFRIWAELTRGLRDRFVNELKAAEDDTVLSPYAGEVLGHLAGMATQSQHMGMLLERLERNDKKAFEAFLAALERS